MSGHELDEELLTAAGLTGKHVNAGSPSRTVPQKRSRYSASGMGEEEEVDVSDDERPSDNGEGAIGRET